MYLPCKRGGDTHHTTPGRSTRGQVRITQDVCLTLQILQTVLDYITDADDTGELAVAQHRHVAHAMTCHQLHHATDTLVRGHGDHAVSHDFLHRHRRGSLAVVRKCVNYFTFGNETKNRLPACHHESADVLYAQPVCCSPNAGFRLYCNDVGTLLPQNGFDSHSCISRVGCPQGDWPPSVSVHPSQ